MTCVFNDTLWTRVATADVEDGGEFYDCAIYAHKTGGGHCIWFGQNEYEGMGEDQSCGTYSFMEGVLRDSDGDIIASRNIVVGSEYPALSDESSEEASGEEYEPSRRRDGGRGRGRAGRGRGRGRARGEGRGRAGRGRGRGRGRAGRGRGRGRGRAGRGRGRAGRGRRRAALNDGQHECPSCFLRCEEIEGINTCHDRHFPWCSKYKCDTSCTAVVTTEVAKEEVGCTSYVYARVCLCIIINTLTNE